MILVDTTVWVDWLRGRKSLCADLLNSALEGRETLAVCGVILTEIMRGIRNPREAAHAEAVLRPLTYLEAGRGTHLRAAELSRNARRRGFTIRSSVDCIIAAVAVEHGAFLLENDRDFAHLAKGSELRLLRFAE